jgi:hypothetical protein
VDHARIVGVGKHDERVEGPRFMRLAFFLLALPACAQILINAGGPAVGAYEADSRFTGGAVWTPAEDTAMGSQSGEFQTLRYGASFAYTVPVAQGGYHVALLMLEPNKTAPAQRRFTATINGHESAALDLFALAGKLTPYEVDFDVSAEKAITINFRATVGNAVVSAIVIRPASQAAKVTGIACTAPTDPAQAAVYAQIPDGTCYPVTVLFPTQAAAINCWAHPDNLLCATANPRVVSDADRMIGWRAFSLFCRDGWRAAMNPRGPSDTLLLVGCLRP